MSPYNPPKGTTLKSPAYPQSNSAYPRSSSSAAGGVFGRRKIWIDLDSSPHVPFFVPIIEELEKRGYSTLLTARKTAQVFELVDYFHLTCKRVGRHYDGRGIVRLAGLLFRALQLAPHVRSGRPDLALSHGSRAQLIVSAALRIPSLMLGDYEFSKGVGFARATWVMCPDVIPETDLTRFRGRLLRYPGIKEDVYVPRFKPDPSILEELGLGREDLIITLRPPADHAHYHRPESDELFRAAVDFLCNHSHTKIVLLPRHERQAIFAHKAWPHLFAAGKIIIPVHAVDGLNLIWHSDLVISGGGTMNREAAALGVPVYSIFRGKIGAVDRYLAEKNRLVLLESAHEVRTKIPLIRRTSPANPMNRNTAVLDTIVNTVVSIMETNAPPPPIHLHKTARGDSHSRRSESLASRHS